MNAVILGQNTISKKSNVGGSTFGAEPYRLVYTSIPHLYHQSQHQESEVNSFYDAV